MPGHANEVDSYHYSSVMRNELNCATSGFRSTGKRTPRVGFPSTVPPGWGRCLQYY
ncbi:hypothetical protein BT69DRAFT_1282973, partial [Atractiella rhizophila]